MAHGRAAHPGETQIEALRRARQWSAFTGSEPWLYAAAGFTIPEAHDALAAGTLDPAQARLLAALRGVTLPVG
jgi:hypothetical protein